jgi:hypothetical protein
MFCAGKSTPKLNGQFGINLIARHAAQSNLPKSPAVDRFYRVNATERKSLGLHKRRNDM